MIAGVLALDKPVGPTSHDAVDRARRSLGTRRIGHFGTLDPFASGLLVLGVGPATRLAPFCAGHPKTYRATVRLGERSDTDDARGAIVPVPVPPASIPGRADVERDDVGVEDLLRDRRRIDDLDRHVLVFEHPGQRLPGGEGVRSDLRRRARQRREQVAAGPEPIMDAPKQG